jgi:gas vesicle protein
MYQENRKNLYLYLQGTDKMNDKERNMQYYKPKKSGIGIGDIFAITIIAAAAGLAMGFLFAPQSGLKTRNKLNNTIKEALDRGRFALLEARVLGEEILEKGIEKAEKVSSKVKNKK